VKNQQLAAVLLTAGFGVSVYAQTPQTQDYRLAFSKAENIEIFVEGATKDSWCAPALALRAVHGSGVDKAALARLLPKLGALFQQQCPQAQDVNWRSVDALGKQFAQGVSHARDGWKVVADAAVAPAPSTPATTGVAAVPVATPTASKPVAQTAVDPQQTVVPVSPPVSTSTPEASPVASTAMRPSSKLLDFAAAGWQPPTAAQRVELTSFMATQQDQNGCKIVSVFDFGDQASYVRLVSENLACGTDGYAQGKGRLRLERSDGALVARTPDLWFSRGLIFDSAAQTLALTDVVATQSHKTWEGDQKILWLGLSSDVSTQSHYLLRVGSGNSGGVLFWRLDSEVEIDVLTSQTEAFRNAESIRAMVNGALASLHEAIPNATRARLAFADAAQGIWDNSSNTIFGAFYADERHDQLLYTLEASRPATRRNGERQVTGAWRYNLQTATNHLFLREKRIAERLAREKKQEADRKEREHLRQLVELARAEEKNLRQYQTLLDLQAQSGVAALRDHFERDISYQTLESRSYVHLMRGGEDELHRVVRVDGDKADDATVDWPYPMRLAGKKSLKKGWYMMTGKRRLDTSQLDDEGLPMSVVADVQVHACEQKGCNDLLNPLSITRIQLNQVDWTPEAAQAVIDAAPKNRWIW